MQRDMSLIRQIMFKMEGEPGGFAPQEFIIDGYPDDQVAYHVYLLGQAGLLEVVKNTNLVSSAPSAHALNMTWEGHDFIDAARSDTTWSRATEKVKTVGGTLSFAVFKQLLDSIIKAQLGF